MKRRFLSVIVIISLVFSIFSLTASADESESPVFDGTLRTSAKGIEMIQKMEGYIDQPKWDVSQNSIGYGCNTTYAKKYGFSDSYLTRDEAHQLMLFVLDEMEPYLDSFLTKYGITVNQHQYDALISLTYNLGKSWISPDSRLGKLLVNGNYTVNELASAFGIYCHTGTGKDAVVLKHLVDRRITEAKLFLYGAYNLSDVPEKFCLLTYAGNVPPDYTDVALYLEGEPYQILFKPDPETSGGMFFNGWYTDEQLTNKLTAYDTVEQSMTVYPKWSWYEEDPEVEFFGDIYVSPSAPALTEKQYEDGICGEETVLDGTQVDDREEVTYELEASKVFSDLSENAWYYRYINALYNENVINGYEDFTFRPERTVTTGEALKMILLAAGYGTPEQVTEHWASGYHHMALDYYIIDQGEITDLDVPITREVMAKVTANALGIERIYDGAVFSDTDNKYACALYDWGITEGYEDGTFRLERSLTRAELSAIVWRINNFF